jgi:hypothetical protein
LGVLWVVGGGWWVVEWFVWSKSCSGG